MYEIGRLLPQCWLVRIAFANLAGSRIFVAPSHQQLRKASCLALLFGICDNRHLNRNASPHPTGAGCDRGSSETVSCDDARTVNANG